MTRAKRLAPVQTLFDDNERRLAQSLAAFERRVTESETKLQELERYRGEYEQQFTQRAGRASVRRTCVTIRRSWRDWPMRFASSRRWCSGARVERDAERLRWQEAARRAKALDHVVERWQAEERRATDRREQRDTDERAQRKVNRP